MTHRSHISSKRAKARGWGRIPPPSIRAETYNLIEEVNSNFMNGQYVSWTDCATNGTTWIPGSTSAGDYYQTWGGYWDTDATQPTITIREIIKEKEVTKEVEKRTLFRVYVVNPRKSGEILLDGKPVIAENENQAMLKAGVLQVAGDAGLELEQVDVYVEKVGTFIRPRKDTQRVKVVKSEEE